MLIKERNKILTMKHEYERLNKRMPGSERLEKVEESMENILKVVDSRKIETKKEDLEEYKVLDEISRVVTKKRRKDELYHDQRDLSEVKKPLLEDGCMDEEERDRYRQIRELHNIEESKRIKKEKNFREKSQKIIKNFHKN